MVATLFSARCLENKLQEDPPLGRGFESHPEPIVCKSKLHKGNIMFVTLICGIVLNIFHIKMIPPNKRQVEMSDGAILHVQQSDVDMIREAASIQNEIIKSVLRKG